MILALIPNWLKYSIAALVAAFLLLASGYHAGKRQGHQDAITDQLKADIKADQERMSDDAKLHNLNDYDFCVLSLRRRGLSVEPCNSLRGL